jgi:pantothenate kinase type III
MKRALVLTIDIGNSQTAIGIYLDAKVEASYRLTTNDKTTSDEIFFRLSDLTRHFGRKPREFTHIGLSSVVPQLLRPWIKALNSYFNKPIQIVSSKNCMDLPIAYPRPASVGPDRLCNVIALRSGILHGFLGQLEYLLNGIKKEVGMENIPVIATGGWGQMFLKHTPIIKSYDPYLTLEGIRLVALNGNGYSNLEGEE